MFSKKDDKSASRKKRFWPWGRKSEEASVEPTQPVEDVKTEAPEETAPAPAVEPSQPAEPVAQQPVAEQEKQLEEPSPVEAAVAEATVQLSAEPVEPIEKVEKPEPAAPVQTAPVPEPQPQSMPAEEPVAETNGFFSRMKSGLAKTRSSLVQGVTTLFIGKKEIDDELLEDLETQLLVSDVGIEATRQIIDGLTQRVAYKELDDADALVNALKAELGKILEPADKPLVIDTSKKPFVILVVGVNGVGKTTTIGKMARQFQNDGKKVMLAAGDTFRAAAVEQLQVWGERNDIPVVAQHTGADSASVLYDAFEAAKARQMDILIADTAGRLHNKDNLMEELKKVKRVLGKIDPEAPHEVLLVVDAGTGQNALSQAHLFDKTVGLTGMALTKLDGTAKGGVTFALSQEMSLPIRFLGVGEQIEDLRPFKAKEFVDALFADLDL
ncbi:signal recognition particle-docking protein FtsY [Sansalvadorimonas sp. 2012CJ34-2]|uniref:Signal recognition particle receptor FtsY n=1 Tax=Parendozoicomonas callyspongiae TaxID=2942213 RepID=A0ABT0PJD0_9GAMM|nr:signal recognition particle-docking protein FtsY [Sansalvadorimonas sp. 2012CJ34-2]MCL6270847.1 signal recognition particle-docking protein FtsY [Sansalvadorimonas sp. 2012CJ34-2]